MNFRKANLGDIEADLRSGDRRIRGRGIWKLLERARKDPAIHEAALPLFHSALKAPQSVSAANQAVDGIETICGAEQALPFRLMLLKDPRPEMAYATVQSMRHPVYLPTLIQCLSTLPAPGVRACAIRNLGQIHEPAAFNALVSQLNVPAMRPHAAEALARHRNPAAIAYLQPLLSDTTPAWEEDNHGPMLRVCDVAGEAIVSLGGTVEARVAPPRLAMAATPRPLVGRGQPAPAMNFPPPRLTSWQQVRPFIPLLAAGLEIPWFLLGILIILFIVGDQPPPPGFSHSVDRVFPLFAIVPAALGLMMGLLIIVHHWPSKLAARICLILGEILCAAVCGVGLYSTFH